MLFVYVFLELIVWLFGIVVCGGVVVGFFVFLVWLFGGCCVDL